MKGSGILVTEESFVPEYVNLCLEAQKFPCLPRAPKPLEPTLDLWQNLQMALQEECVQLCTAGLQLFAFVLATQLTRELVGGGDTKTISTDANTLPLSGFST